MPDAQVSIAWTGDGLRFEAAHPSHNNFRVDGDGQTAHSPVQSLLLSLASCMGADIVDITGRMRVVFSGLVVDVSADRNAEAPRYLTAVHMKFTARGVAAADTDKLERALDLSNEKYCSVLHSLRKDIRFSSELVIE